MDNFIILALLGGIGLFSISSPIGCFIIWKRMSYFGDALAHSTLLGVALGFVTHTNIDFSVILFTLIFCFTIHFLKKSDYLHIDSIINIIASFSLSLGIIIVSLVKDQRIDLYSIMFGDILSLNLKDIGYIYLFTAIVGFWLKTNWDKLLIITINRDLAKIEIKNPNNIELQFNLIVALFVALAVKIVGILLITSMLIIPAATARFISNSPEKMAIFGILISYTALVIGLLLSYYYDIGSSPAIVLACSTLFFMANINSSLRIKSLR